MNGKSLIVITLILFIGINCYNVNFKLNELDSPPKELKYCGKDNNSILVLTQKNILYKSDDHGYNWKKLNDILNFKGKETLSKEQETIGNVFRIMNSPVDKDLVVFMGTHGIHWVTDDCGKTINALNSNIVFNDFKFHPTVREWGLASTFMTFDGKPFKKYNEIYLTKDLGRTWKKLIDGVVSYSWAGESEECYRANMPKERILVSHQAKINPKKSDDGWSYKVDLYYSDDFFVSKKLALHKGNKFIISQKYLFVAQVEDQENQEVTLMVSDSRLPEYHFKNVKLPLSLKEHSYSITDTSEDSVFLMVNHAGEDARYGHLYISDVTGVNYSLSLRYNLMSNKYYSDIDKVEGLEGIYLANRIDPTFMKENKKQVIDVSRNPMGDTKQVRAIQNEDASYLNYVQTIVTFNKGSQWNYLAAPQRDVDGKLIECGDYCFLHLHGTTSKYPPYYTSPNAKGIVLGNGNIGQHLSNNHEELSTFMSRDGGLTWLMIRKGPHLYEIGDHGGIIVIADCINLTDTVYYSLDEGISWNDVRISDTPIKVITIEIEETSTSHKFLVYGEKPTKTDKVGFITPVDFVTLGLRNCVKADAPGLEDSDYELWSPNDGRIGQECLMGRKTTYVRRKREVECLNGEKFERKVFVENCQCHESDFECDYGYYRPKQKEKCIPVKGFKVNDLINPTPPDNCIDYYTVTKGYRRIPGNSCINGQFYEPLVLPCPGFRLNRIFGLIIVFIILAALVILMLSTFNKDFFSALKDFFRKYNVYYNPNPSSSNNKRKDKYKSLGNTDEFTDINDYSTNNEEEDDDTLIGSIRRP